MDDTLKFLGADLATQVNQNGLPTTDLDVEKPEVEGYKFFDYVVKTLTQAMNSTFWVGDDLEYINSYINSLSLLMARKDKFAEKIRQANKRMDKVRSIEPSLDYGIRVRIEMLVGKRLYVIDAEKLIELSMDAKEDEIFYWKNIIVYLLEKAKEHDYFYVMHNIHKLFTLHKAYELNLMTRANIARHLFFATQGKVSLTFLAPVRWTDYVRDIENGLHSYRLTQARTPILLSPRPDHLPLPVHYLPPPDEKYEF